ncbi:MAG: hypothetical protein JJW00_01335 [Sulfurimonas sp.]|nr:hypothetical protein [Sulfurimonas sp.]
MRQLDKEEIKKLGIFNDKLIALEKKIYNLCLTKNKIVLKKLLDKEIVDYELNVNILFYGETYMTDKYDNEHLLLNLKVGMKHSLLKDDRWGIADDNCHNVSTIFQKDKDLNTQKHCYLLHSLYDDYHFAWDDIFKIEDIYFDIIVQYDYEAKAKSWFI